MEPDDLKVLAADQWLGSIPEARRLRLLAHGKVRAFADGARIYRLDDPPNGLHAVLSGEARLVSYPVAGVELVGKIIRPGQWFGELSVLDGKGRPHDAVAIGSCRVLTVGMSSIAAATARDPELWRDIAVLSCIHQRAGLRDTGRIRTEPAVTRLAGFLAGAGAAAEGRNIRMTQDEIAQVIGISRQYLNRLVREIAQTGLIEIRYGRIHVPRPHGLRGFAPPPVHRDGRAPNPVI